METYIYLSKKLESVVPEYLIKPTNKELQNTNPLGKWNATLFYANRMKCLLLTNSITRYTVILENFKVKDFVDLEPILSITLFKQLMLDEIDINNLNVSGLIGKVNLFKTDNDKKITGTQNYLLQNMDYWIKNFSNFREINRIINHIPYVQLGHTNPQNNMKSIINSLKK